MVGKYGKTMGPLFRCCGRRRWWRQRRRRRRVCVFHVVCSLISYYHTCNDSKAIILLVFVTIFFKKFLKNASYIFMSIFKLKKTILHQVGHVFNIFESSLSHKDRESISRPKIVSIAESFIRVNLKDLSEFPLRTKE